MPTDDLIPVRTVQQTTGFQRLLEPLDLTFQQRDNFVDGPLEMVLTTTHYVLFTNPWRPCLLNDSSVQPFDQSGLWRSAVDPYCGTGGEAGATAGKK